jgi:large subunit ribosomal protein L14
LIKVSDSSNANYVKCFNVCKKSGSFIGTYLYGSIKSIKTKGKFMKGNTVKGILIRERKSTHRQTGNYLKFDHNEIILLNEKGEVFNTKISGLLSLDLRKKKHLRLLSLSSYFL